MLSAKERKWVMHLHDAGKGGLEIARKIESRRIEKIILDSDILTEVLEYLYLMLSYNRGLDV